MSVDLVAELTALLTDFSAKNSAWFPTSAALFTCWMILTAISLSWSVFRMICCSHCCCANFNDDSTKEEEQQESESPNNDEDRKWYLSRGKRGKQRNENEKQEPNTQLDELLDRQRIRRQSQSTAVRVPSDPMIQESVTSPTDCSRNHHSHHPRVFSLSRNSIDLSSPLRHQLKLISHSPSKSDAKELSDEDDSSVSELSEIDSPGLILRRHTVIVPPLIQSDAVESTSHDGKSGKHRRRYSVRSSTKVRDASVDGLSGLESSLLHCSPVFTTMMSGCFDSSVLTMCESSEIFDSFEMIASLICTIPWSVSAKLCSELIKALKSRVKQSAMLQRKLLCFRQSHAENKHVNDTLSDLLMDAEYDDHHCCDADQFGIWEMICNRMDSFEMNDEIIVEDGESGDHQSSVTDPLTLSDSVSKVRVRKIFESNARPIWVELWDHNGAVMNEVLLKKGDDLRQDSAVMDILKVLNYVWKKEGMIYEKEHPIMALTYVCQPITNDFGVIELIDDCLTLKHVASLHLSDDDNDDDDDGGNPSITNTTNSKKRLVSTSVGAFIAGHLLQIRDRHFDNVLIRSDGSLFHIDFGFIFGESPSLIDASSLAITPDLQSQLGDRYWRDFVDYSIKAFLCLRKHRQMIVDLARMRFSLISDDIAIKAVRTLNRIFDCGVLDDSSDDFTSKVLSDHEMESLLRSQLERAPLNWNTYFKNAVHDWAHLTRYPVSLYQDFVYLAFEP